MKMVTKRELSQNTAAVLGQVADSEDVIVTERGKPRWRIGTIREHDTVLERLERLEREGRYAPPASSPTAWPNNPAGRAFDDAGVETLLDEMRGDH